MVPNRRCYDNPKNIANLRLTLHVRAYDRANKLLQRGLRRQPFTHDLPEQVLVIASGLYPSIYGYPNSISTALMFWCFLSTEPRVRPERRFCKRRLWSPLLYGSHVNSFASIEK
jgi:hypothetical protein